MHNIKKIFFQKYHKMYEVSSTFRDTRWRVGESIFTTDLSDDGLSVHQIMKSRNYALKGLLNSRKLMISAHNHNTRLNNKFQRSRMIVKQL